MNVHDWRNCAGGQVECNGFRITITFHFDFSSTAAPNIINNLQSCDFPLRQWSGGQFSAPNVEYSCTQAMSRHNEFQHESIKPLSFVDERGGQWLSLTRRSHAATQLLVFTLLDEEEGDGILNYEYSKTQTTATKTFIPYYYNKINNIEVVRENTAVECSNQNFSVVINC